MTVLSYQANRFNVYANKISWQKNRRANTAAAKITSLLSLFTLVAIISGIIFYIFWMVKITDSRLDIQKAEEKIQTLEEKNADLKTQLSYLSTPTNLDKVLANTKLVKESRPNYFANQKSVNSIGFNKGNNAASE